jgi:hypothetical protein
MTATGPRAHVFDHAPVMLYWEITRACDLACAHCRADAMPHRDPRELDTPEAMGLLSQIADFGPPFPHLVITGGDPLKRPDLADIVKQAAALKIQVSMAPSATPLLTRKALGRLARAGILGLSLSLDGATAPRHDALRGIAGCFQRTLTAAREAADAGLSVQVNTLVSGETMPDLPAIFALVSMLPIQRWSLFFLIGVGRGRVLRGLTADQAEEVCHCRRDRGAVLSARRPRARSARRALAAQRPIDHTRVWDPRRQRDRVCLAPRRRAAGGVSAGGRRQHPRDAAGRSLPPRAAVHRAARRRPAWREMRALSVQRALWRIEGARLRAQRRLSRRRPAVRVRSA